MGKICILSNKGKLKNMSGYFLEAEDHKILKYSNNIPCSKYNIHYCDVLLIVGKLIFFLNRC